MGSASLGGMAAMHAQGGLPIPDIHHIGQPHWWAEGGDMDPDAFGLVRARELEEAILELGEDLALSGPERLTRDRHLGADRALGGHDAGEGGGSRCGQGPQGGQGAQCEERTHGQPPVRSRFGALPERPPRLPTVAAPRS